MSDRPPIFGTDGVRDRAGEGYLAPESVRRLMAATADVLRERERFADEIPPGRGDVVYVGRDTRRSGEILLAQVSAELRYQGFSVADVGVLPTGGVAYMASVHDDCCLAVVLSASHNPATYNGIKLLAPIGAKASVAFEEAVADRYHETGEELVRERGSRGSMLDLTGQALSEYTRFLVACSWRPERLVGKRVMLDTAQGAASRAAPEVFRALGMQVECLANSPDGSNINRDCGALHPELLAGKVRAGGACLGLCFDGDADRMIPITRSGRVLDGDHVLALAGRYYHRVGKLPKKTVVATVMSNLGLEKALEQEGLRLLRTPVGDRHVYQALAKECHPLGGEQSGHIIFLDDLHSGDGLLAAVRLLDVLESGDLDLDAEAKIMTQYPQVLRNVPIREKVEFSGIPSLAAVLRDVEQELGSDGRILLRYSGTEPLARVMLEGPDQKVIDGLCDKICRVIRENLSA